MTELYDAELVERTTVAADTREITVQVNDQGFSFDAGQFIMLTLPELHYEDGRGKTRSFSLASPPREENVVTAYRISDSGYKQTLEELEPGHDLQVRGPFGHFTLPSDETRPVVFLAGGIGITPFRSMLLHSLANETGRDIHLVYGNRNKKRAAYHDELETLTEQYDRFTMQSVFRDITADDVTAAAENVIEPYWYLAGPPQMVRDLRHLLIAADVPGDRVRTETFSGY